MRFFCISRSFSTILPSLAPIPLSSLFLRSMCQYPIGSTLFSRILLACFRAHRIGILLPDSSAPMWCGLYEKTRTHWVRNVTKKTIYQSKGVALSTVVYTTMPPSRFTLSRPLLVFLYSVKTRHRDDTVFTRPNFPKSTLLSWAIHLWLTFPLSSSLII